MKNYFLSAFVFIVLFYTPKSAISNSYAACDLTYTCLGGNNYIVTFTYYNDCSGDLPSDSITVNFISSCDTFNAIFPQVGTPVIIKPYSSSAPTCCDSNFSGCNYGLKRYIYQKIIFLSPCSNWIISWSGGYRNISHNIVNPTAQPFYINAFINNLIAPCNSSPEFDDSDETITCKGKDFCYWNQLWDIDGDSIVLSLVAPQIAAGVSVPYLGGYSNLNPIPSAPPFQTNWGEICFNCPVSFISAIAIKIEEWRKINGINILVGYVIREIQINVADCINTLPKLSGININATQYNPNDTIYIIKVSKYDTINFNVYAFDADIPKQNLYMHNGPAPNYWMVTDNNTTNPIGHFHFDPNTATNEFPKSFNVCVHDNAWPIGGFKSFQFFIKDTIAIGINSHNYENTLFDIFPNPANDNITITYTSNIEDDVFAGIYSVEGKLMQSIPIIQKKTEINIAALPKGIFFIKIESSLGIGVKKMIKQ